MKKQLAAISLFVVAVSASASEEWKSRLYCYGTLFSSSDYVVELQRAVDNDGLIRNVYFQKNVNSNRSLVTDTCSREGQFLVCKSDKILVKVDVSTRYSHRGLWDAAGYTYFPAKVTRNGFFSDRTEEVRCRD